MLACLRRGTVCRPLIIPLPTGLLGVRWLILVLTALLGVGWQLAVLRLVAVCRLLRRRSPEKHFKESVLASLRRLCCGVGDRRGGAVPVAVLPARPSWQRAPSLAAAPAARRPATQRLRVANLDRDADDRRLVDRSGFFRIRVAAVTGKTGDLWGRVLDLGARRRVRQVAQTVQFVGALERGV